MTSPTSSHQEWLGFSLKSMLLILIGIVLLGLYIGVLLFGENSLVILNRLEHDRERLMQEKREMQTSNQKLQKEYFELLQLTE